MKQKIVAFITVFALLVAIVPNALAAKVIDERLGVPIVVYGANLSEAEKQEVKKSLNIADDDTVEEITVAGSDLNRYISNSNPNAQMFSSAKITLKNQGEGLVIDIVTPKNITEITSDIYANAMLTAGIEDALVEVAAPKPVTGHSALAGIYKAYEERSGETLDTERTDVANDELNVATTIAQGSDVSDEKVAELLTEIKKQIAENTPTSREEVEQIVNDQLSKLEINLSEQDRQMLIDLMDKIRGLNIDFSKWTDQLNDLSQSIGDKIDSLTSEDGFWGKVKAFFQNIVDTIASWFK
ncbi:hypothetical protein GCM10007425_19600 [Lysinibacillus alkalisoli]|uniref:DUF1002 domain-containing protein n=1 Tax=Lysinibacillus alkalisoli TaxID=1911548 RepID=A0A917G6G2_9BACI|nr:DUF1002 domain-containing protein [Lysinibacillus alkalisoli]GGG25096.1 hypothetical protein GCM10007425_19600 [Lysinibacillus alkalisoli]